jgi:hypothetical protein
MTPTANIGRPAPLSELTVRSLADLGYVVNPWVADAFTLPQAAIRVAGAPRQTMDLSNDVDPTQPLYMVDPFGRMTRMRQ